MKFKEWVINAVLAVGITLLAFSLDAMGVLGYGFSKVELLMIVFLIHILLNQMDVMSATIKRKKRKYIDYERKRRK